MTQSDEVFLAARQCLLARKETIDDFQAAAECCETYSECVSGDERTSLKMEFEAFAGDYASNFDADDDPDGLRQVASDLEALGEKFGVDTQDHTQGLLERADEIETERAEPEPEDDDGRRWSAETVVDDVQGMFAGLESDLRDG